jgi:hypothetical protein
LLPRLGWQGHEGFKIIYDDERLLPRIKIGFICPDMPRHLRFLRRLYPKIAAYSLKNLLRFLALGDAQLEFGHF